MASVWGELKRRNVVRVAIAYAIVAWLMIEVSATTFPMLKLPEWSATLVTVLLLIGFPVAMIFAWAFELTPEGLKKEKDVDRSESITHVTGRKIDFIIIGVLLVALAVFAVERFVLLPERAPATDALQEIVATEVQQSIAVLPFVNMSSDEEQEYFSDGITEEILNALVAVEGLTVVGRTSSFAFKGKNEDLRNIGRALGVDHLVEGSVRKSGVTVRITAQLVRADTGTHLWSETYDREITDIFKVQDEISAAIAGALKITLLGAAERPATATVDPEAFDLYLRARHDLDVPTFASLAAAVEKLQQVKRMDPGFLDARVKLSGAFWLQANFGSRPEREVLALAEAEARAVLAIDPDFAGAYVALAAVSGGSGSSVGGDPVAALAHMETALEKGANTGEAWIEAAFWRARAGDHAGARAAIEQAIALDPMNGDLHNNVGRTYMNMGDYQAAARSFARSIALQPTTTNWWNLGWIRLFGLGDVRGAIEAYSQCVTLDPTDPENLTPLAGAWLDIGDIEAASKAVAKALDLAPNRGWSHWVNGLILRQQGRRREALALMQASLDDPATVHRFGSFLRLTVDIVRFHMEDGDFDAAKARLLKSYPDVLARLTPPDLRADWWRDPTALFIQVLRAKGEDEKAARLTPYTDTFSEDYFRRLGRPLTNGGVNRVLATAALAAGDDARALDYLQAAYEGGFVASWRSRYGAPDFYALWDHPRHKALMARIEADMEAQRAAMMAAAAD